MKDTITSILPDKNTQKDNDFYNTGSPELYLNIKPSDIPPYNHPDFLAFGLEEKRKGKEGININGQYIPGNLYYHTQFHTIQLDVQDNMGKVVRPASRPYLRDNEWIIHNDYYRAQQEKKAYVIGGARQISKDLLNSSLLYKEDGETTIGQAKVGESIYDHTGKLTTITGVYPQGVKPVYEITLLDGRKLYCGLDHNWYVWNYKKSNGHINQSKKNSKSPLGGFEVKTTVELIADYQVKRIYTESRKNSYESKYAIPTAEAVQYPEKELTIDPYILGLWLGDGDNRRAGLTTIDSEIEDVWCSYAINNGYQCTKYENKTSKAVHLLITNGKKYLGCRSCSSLSFTYKLKELDVLNNKRIPENYKKGSVAQRMALLQGLMDSDGSISKRGIISFSSSIAQLAKDFDWLCRSLGITLKQTATRSFYTYKNQRKEGKTAYKFQLYTSAPVFRLPRKLALIKTKTNKNYEGKSSIVNIQYVFDAETTCITVDNKEHLYLTDGFTVTHNSDSLVSLTCRELFLYPGAEVMGLFSIDEDKQTFNKKLGVALSDGRDLWETTRELIDPYYWPESHPNFLVIPNIDNDLTKKEIRFGMTRKNNEITKLATLFTYLTQAGKKTQVGAGKALKHGSKVYYEDRIGTIEECKVGEKIYGADGKLTTITGVYPQGIVDLYKITFRDGRTVTCCKHHLWTVQRLDKTAKSKKEIILSTEELLKTYKRTYFNKKLNKQIEVNRYALNPISTLEYPFQQVDIDPYYLGMWLGDGTTNATGHITTTDHETVEYLKNYAEALNGRLTTNDKYLYKICSKNDFGHSPLVSLFKKYKLKGNKHIPLAYLYNDKETRLQVLRGLLDSDGHIDKQGRVELCITNKILVDDAVSLIRSLGINCSVSIKHPICTYKGKKVKGKLAYRIYIGSPSETVFNLTRKKEAHKKTPIQSIQNGTSIVNIEKVESDYATCISVDNEDHLFLTDNFIPTHNSLTFFFYEEIAKEEMRGVWEAVKPAIRSEFGFRCAAFMAFTGGSVDKSKDALNLFMNPESNGVMPFENENKKTGKFMGGWYRSDFKYKTTLAKYLGVEDAPQLDAISIQVTDFDKANKTLDHEQALAADDSEPMALTNAKMFAPRTLAEMSLSSIESPFRKYKEGLKKHQDWLYETKPGQAYEFFLDPTTGKTHALLGTGVAISNFPHKSTDILDAPPIVYDLPRQKFTQDLHIGGLDIYHLGQTETSPSLGAFYLLRRNYGSLNDPFQDSIVLSYVARLDRTGNFLDKIQQILDFYQAKMLHESTNDMVLEHFDKEHKAEQYLAKSYSLIQEYSPHSKSRSTYGVPATVSFQKAWMLRIIEYISEIIGVDAMGNPIYGYTRISDPMLIEEMLQYKDKLNVDRCFPGHTTIQTGNGYKPINQITLQDNVLTHEGVYSTVDKLIVNNYSGKMISLKILSQNETIDSTPNHPHLVNSFSVKPNGKEWQSLKNNPENFNNRKWKLAKDIKKGDYLLIPKRNNLVQTELSKEELYVLGWYLSDGHINKQGQLRITFQGNQLNLANHVKECLESFDDFATKRHICTHHLTGKKFTSFTTNKGISIKKIPNKYAYNLNCTSKAFSNLVKKYVTVLEGGEKILNQDLFCSEGLLPLVVGFLEGDGHQKSCNYDKNGQRNTIEVTGVYINLIDQIRQILLDNDIWCTTRLIKAPDNCKWNQRTQKKIDIQDWKGINKIVSCGSLKFSPVPDKVQKTSFIKTTEGYWLPVSTIKEFDYSGLVYNLEVNKQHSYTANHIATHNCVAFGHALLYKGNLAKDYPPQIEEEYEETVEVKSKKAIYGLSKSNGGFSPSKRNPFYK